MTSYSVPVWRASGSTVSRYIRLNFSTTQASNIWKSRVTVQHTKEAFNSSLVFILLICHPFLTCIFFSSLCGVTIKMRSLQGCRNCSTKPQPNLPPPGNKPSLIQSRSGHYLFYYYLFGAGQAALVALIVGASFLFFLPDVLSGKMGSKETDYQTFVADFLMGNNVRSPFILL